MLLDAGSTFEKPAGPDTDASNDIQPKLSIVQAAAGSTLKGAWRYRAFDLAFVLFAAPSVVLVLIFIALIVKLDDPRSPVFFRQTRYGRDGKPFQMLKVRSMVPNADQIKVALLAQSADKGAGFKLERDPRVTRPGRFLRQTYLDELPQFWNVLRGEMAIVGPRANSANPMDLEPWQRLRLSVRPGITGSWQTMRDKPKDFQERCRIDLDYIRQKSLLGDLRILFRTVNVMLVRPTGL
ncbi:sugar transferase [Tabrizicola sp.]|uniref:sugar transferase n=1 Tax=Tabrizicola sp. TaxID=2005166 RepID=UPI003F3E3109